MTSGARLPSIAPISDPSPLGWVAAELGMSLQLDAAIDADGGLTSWDALVGLALRRNPRRAHLLVSRVLGKHLPVDPRRALAAAGALARRVQRVTSPDESPLLVLGFAETATALGQAVAAALVGAECVLSTRRPGPESVSFAEEHSHATAHRVLAPAAMIDRPRTVVLVDDELSSGRTAVNTIRALHQRSFHPGYVVAALLDMRPPDARAELEKLSAELGVPIRAVSLLSGALQVPADAPQRVAALVAAAGPQRLDPCWPADRLRADWPADLRLGARHGWTPADEARLDDVLPALVERLLRRVPDPTARILFLGTEELMYTPMKLAAVMADAAPLAQVRYQSTTRSPVAPIDRDGYAVRCALAFGAPDEPERESFVYNVRPGIADHIFVVTDGGDTAPLVAALCGCAPVTEVLLRDEVLGSE